MDISVIIPVYNDTGHLERCLSSLTRSGLPEHEVVVVDDGSDRPPGETARRFGARFIALPRNRGPAAARNTGARHAAGKTLVFLDADTECGEGCLAPLVASLAEGWDAAVGHYAKLSGVRTGFFSLYKHAFVRHYHSTSSERVDWFWTACGAVGRDTFLRAGGFDESFSWKSVEDIEFGYRLARSGGRIRFCPGAQVSHHHRFTLPGILVNDYRKARDWTRLNLGRNAGFALKHPSAQFSRRGPGIILSLAVAAALAASPLMPQALPAACLCILAQPFIDRSFFAALARDGGKRALLQSLVFKPVDDLTNCLGVAAGTAGHLRGLTGLKKAPA